MLQVPNLPAYQLTQPNYNAVKIDIHNPSVGGATCPVQPAAPQMPYAQAPMAQQTPYYYNYPQAQLYDYQQAYNQPYYMPAWNNQSNATVNQNVTQNYSQPAMQPAAQPVAAQSAAQMATQPVVQQPVAQATADASVQAQAAVQCPPCPPCPVCSAQQAAQANDAYVAAAATAAASATAAAPQQININQAPVAPSNEPVTVVNSTVPVAEQPKVEIKEPVNVEAAMPKVDVNAFLAKLSNPDFETQANAMEEIANMVKDEPQKATELLDSKIINSLVDAMNADSSKLAGPTQEQIALREKMLNGQQISDQEKSLAMSITPMEQAERNKSYAMFTTAILDKLYGDEVLKLTGSRVPLTELPGVVSIVDQLKDNPNPLVRASAIDALSYIQTPEYKKDLDTLFTIAKKDQDKGVQEAAATALDKLNQV